MLFRNRKQRFYRALLFLLRKGVARQSLLPVWLFSGLGIAACNWWSPPEKPIRFDAHFPASDERIACRLQKVVDGDTVHARCGGRLLNIRLLGIDAPESGQKPWGGRSTAALSTLVGDRFSLQPHGADYYRRQLGILYDRQGRDINLQMVLDGRAVAYSGKDTPKAYVAAEKSAKAKKLGIWGEPGLQQNPRRWRRENPR